MREYKIAICDDEEYYLEELYTYIRTYANEREVKIVCDRYSSGWDIANKVEEDVIIPVFLELLIIVVFVTEYISHYVLASFMTLFIYLDMFIQKKRDKKSK